ncbi:ADP-ribosylation factor-binding GGA1 [Brachionus plicatilis]|uniref:ADP-ribosylation factor-binding GGA1 n=1 Tax=Brachionus plicatilis TaxID=10195 RepID=A0A3M7RDV7_BRAPC|nr:ADP-ribosylation factor-binding GGA1 [Brachionus plicatilis]
MNFNFTSNSTSSRKEIESLFHKIFSPIKKELDPNLVGQFCQKLNSDLDGAQLALDLLSPKIQSSQEWEAMIALYTLEACVKNCGERFHDAVARFRFLNEIIKLISPKYYGNRTSEKVKQRCIEILYSWYLYLNRPKIKEAYEMLKKQGIVTEDPMNVDKLDFKVPPRISNPIFEDGEKSKKLQQLLKSKNPQDLEEANRIIKNMVRQDEMKTEKISNRINELEHINNNIRLLNDMLLNYNSASVTESEKETIKYLYEELDKMRPKLVTMASETDDNDEAIGDIIKTNEQCEKIIGQYKLIFLKHINQASSDDKLVSLTSSVHKDEELFSSLETPKPSNYDPLKELEELFANPISNSTKNVPEKKFDDLLTSDTNLMYNNMQDLFTTMSLKQNAPASQTYVMPKNQIQNKIPAKTPQLKALDELNQLGKDLMEKSLINPSILLNAGLERKMGSNENDVFSLLNDLNFELEAIKPNVQIGPFELYNKNMIKIVLHFASNTPNEFISVCVLSVTSLNTENVVKNFNFQAAVPKSMKLKLQPASRSDLPIYNPILPPTAITQILLIANPSKEQIKLKYKLGYSIDETEFNEPDNVKILPDTNQNKQSLI